MLEVLYHHSKFGGARISRFHPLPGRPKTLNFLSVCLSVCLSARHACERHLAMKALQYRNDFDAVG